MLPPGLGFIALSDRAWEKTKKAKLPRFYFDLNLERKNQQKGSGAFTPAVSLIFGVRASLQMLEREGLENVYARHARLCRATRAAATALGLKLLAPDSPSPAATGIYLPSGIDADQVLDYLRDKMNVTLAEGQDQLKGKAIRIAHIGYMGAFDVITAIAALEMALQKIRRRDSLRTRRRGRPRSFDGGAGLKPRMENGGSRIARDFHPRSSILDPQPITQPWTAR